MYLSRVQIDDRNRQKIKTLNQLQAYHGWVENCFPENDRHHSPRRLWRTDYLDGKRYLLILSATKPALSALEKYGVEGSAASKDYDRYVDSLKEGQIMRFRLTANPVHRVTVPGQKQGHIYPHVTIDQQKKWLLDRCAKNGFAIVDNEAGEPSFDVVERDHPVLTHKGQHRVRLSRVSFEGLLKITDLAQFKQTLRSGLGREKAYGMGLLTVIPAGPQNA